MAKKLLTALLAIGILSAVACKASPPAAVNNPQQKEGAEVIAAADTMVLSYFPDGRSATVDGEPVAFPGGSDSWRGPVLLAQFTTVPYHAGKGNLVRYGENLFLLEKNGAYTAQVYTAAGFWGNSRTYILLLHWKLGKDFDMVSEKGVMLNRDTMTVVNLLKTGRGLLRPSLNPTPEPERFR